MRTDSLIAVGIAAFALVSCGGGDEPPGRTTTATSATTSPTMASPTASPSPASAEACTPEPPTSLSSGWIQHQARGGDFTFSYPAEWEDLSGIVNFEAETLVAAETLAETGLTSDDTVQADFVRDPIGFTPNISVFQFDGVSSATDVIYQREEVRYGQLAGIQQVLGTGLTACIGGDPALGIEFLFVPEGADEAAYQRNWYIARGGSLYIVQLLAEDETASNLLDEVLSTWEWTGPVEAASPGAVAFAEAATASFVDPAADAPDPATFTETFPSDSSALYVVFRLQEGVGGEVRIVWKMGDQVVNESSLTLPEDGTWGINAVTPPAEGLRLGAYEVTLTFVETGETRTLPFSVVDA